MNDKRQITGPSLIETDVIEEIAYAKINLHLRITGRRSDGYHELETIFQEITLADKLTFTPHRDKIILSVGEAELPIDETNLVMRAAIRMRKLSKETRGAVISLEKHIPIAAGLGGGSSDAAATLRGLCRLWGLAISEKTLFETARDLGADVPFFLTGGTALGKGIGDLIQSIDPPPAYPVLLIKPSFAVSTAWVYKNVSSDLTKQEYTNNSNALIPSLKRLTLEAWKSFFHNDLEMVVLDRFPEVKRHKTQLFEAGAGFVLMSGSGPTVFGVFDDEKTRDSVAKDLTEKHIIAIRCDFRVAR